MAGREGQRRKASISLAFLLALTAYLVALRLSVGEALLRVDLAQSLVWSIGIMLVAAAASSSSVVIPARIRRLAVPLVFIFLVITGFLWLRQSATWAAWLALGGFYVLLLVADGILTAGRSRWPGLLIRIVLVVSAGLVPVAAVEIESHFADEEFFMALQAVALSLFWLLLLSGHKWLLFGPRSPHPRGETPGQEPLPRRGWSAGGRWLAFLLIAAAVTGTAITVHAYQTSFYAAEAPSYPGVSQQAPFLCGPATVTNSETYSGADVFARLLSLVAANPQKGPPEYAMLALGSGQQSWAVAFRDSLLQEAAAERFTGPSGSVKSTQYEAALRAYYFPRMRASFPNLFSPAQVDRVRRWFANINRRALTVEWVDWMYALAFNQRPAGPYENQENGAGLLAALLAGDLAPANLAEADRSYLVQDPRGWVQRFHNTDDAFIYQAEWIVNAYLQSQYIGQPPAANLHRSFDWLAMQALPDGAPLRYNHPTYAPLAAVAYLGARLTDDPTYLWLAGKSLANLGSTSDGYLPALPGAEVPLSMTGRTPGTGSCLVYSDSGLPNQVGPLAPDKIVLRDGWDPTSAYVLLNLRFTGWHRYRGTNTVTLAYQQGALAADDINGKPFSWLPVGRSLFRDKRIPRENLNGLLVNRTGMSRVLYVLMGIGGPWAQDPPYYAQVVNFSTGAAFDASDTRLAGWRGWQHDRRVYLYHQNGPIVVLDDAVGPAGAPVALAWHFPGGETAADTRVHLRQGTRPAEAVILSLAGAGRRQAFPGQADPSSGNPALAFQLEGQGELHAATIFLTGSWVGANVTYDAARRTLHISGAPGQIDLPVAKDSEIN